MCMGVISGLAETMGNRMYVGVRVPNRAVFVGMDMELSLPPAIQQAHRQHRYDPTDNHFRPALHRLRQAPAEQNDRKPEDEERGGMSQPPGESKQSGVAHPVLLLVEEQGGYRGQMIRIQRVTEAEDERDDVGSGHGEIIPHPRSKITDTLARRRIDSRP